MKAFYRVAPLNDGVVFATPERATLVARLHRAIERSRTWGQFRKAIPPQEYSRIVRSSFDDMGQPRPRSTDAFSGESICGWSDGDYPPWLQREMDLFLPKEVLRRYGTQPSSVLNGSFWLIPSENLEAVCDALRGLGWVLERAQKLEFY